MHPLNIAVIGSGISGLSAAWLLAKKHNVTLFEKNAKLGGHTNTVEIDIGGSAIPVDTGFICMNAASYPNLVALFEYLNVPTHDTNMSFAASMNNGAYEYSSGTYFGLFGQPGNLFNLSHWKMIRDILRFFKEAPLALETLCDEETLAEFLSRKKYSAEFAQLHLLPMAAAIWSSKLTNMMDYPAKAFIRFFSNHGLLQVSNRPKWSTVDGGAQVYIDKIISDSKLEIHTNCPIHEVRRFDSHVEVSCDQGTKHFDQVVIASHADQALAILGDPSSSEQKLLGSFDYSKNVAVLHKDRRFMPKRKMTWASWNYMDFASSRISAANNNTDLCLTYWMNSLQNLKTDENVFVTLNPPQGANMEDVAASFDYSHPVFDGAAMAAQRDLWSLQGINRTWYCGAHFGAGFHEDGLQSGLAVAEQLGNVRRPWSLDNESGRIYLLPLQELVEAAE